ncbi:MAG: diguanylate cyclase [Chloroflexi bacterium]|nr:diguanylate cyclase [Chloroflexota bacterium]
MNAPTRRLAPPVLPGDEFVLLLPRTDTERADQVATRIRASLTDANRAQPPLPLGLSTGVATAASGALPDAFTQADERMVTDTRARKIVSPAAALTGIHHRRQTTLDTA